MSRVNEVRTSSQFPFLTARWTNLALITYTVSPEILVPHLPPGCELDTIDGDAFVSLVAFDFLDTRVLGFPWPGFRNFPEINLRFYVRHNGERGVSFLREFVPQRFVSWMARTIYNEPYRAAKMSSRVRRADTMIEVRHALNFNQSVNQLKITCEPKPFTPSPDSREHFFKEHCWGFGRSRSGRLIRYRVEHALWEIYPVKSLELHWDFAEVYGSKWKFLGEQRPISTILAAGSGIKVFPKARLTASIEAESIPRRS
jgi:uncharacterized protein YqjF (DUF2071 family)